jgi:hypothetical protein
MPFVVAGLVIVALIVLVRQVVTANPRTLARLIRGIGLGLIGLFGLVLALRGLAVLDLPLGGLMVYLIHHWSARGFPGVARVKAWVAGRPHTPGSSSIETALLRMTLDPTTGTLTGEVLSGQFAGAALDALNLVQLRALLRECAATDPQSERLIETYLDRTHPDWRQPPPPQAAPGEAMTRTEALQVLGLTGEPTPADIRQAHRRLMTRLHPDQGGSDYLASKINTARDVLLAAAVHESTGS